MSDVTELVSGPITASSDSIAVQLIQPNHSPSVIMIVWQSRGKQVLDFGAGVGRYYLPVGRSVGRREGQRKNRIPNMINIADGQPRRRTGGAADPQLIMRGVAVWQPAMVGSMVPGSPRKKLQRGVQAAGHYQPSADVSGAAATTPDLRDHWLQRMMVRSHIGRRFDIQVLRP